MQQVATTVGENIVWMCWGVLREQGSRMVLEETEGS